MNPTNKPGVLIAGFCFLTIMSASGAGFAPSQLPHLKDRLAQPPGVNQETSESQAVMDRVVAALESAGVMSADFSPGMIPVEGGTLPEASELAGTEVGSFLIGKYEVTYGEWKEVQDWGILLENGYDLNHAGRWSSPQNPVVGVSWYDALKWCNARSEKEGLVPVYQVDGETYKTGERVPSVDSSANGYRLPTEAEWEWAARGGVASKGFIYSGSDRLNEVAWYFGSFVGEGTKAVGTKLENELGIHDMSGNVFEWCWDSRGTQKPTRTVRGGCWAYPADDCAVHNRGSGIDPGIRLILIGFRVARNEIR